LKTPSYKIAGFIIAFCFLVQGKVFAHAFPDHAEPRVGSHISKPPADVRIWFTMGVEPDFSVIQVFDSNDKEVDQQDTHIDPKDDKLLIVSVPPLAAGTYKVSWHVVAEDTHKTHGDFKFTIDSQ
jgi:copper resistance protein C